MGDPRNEELSQRVAKARERAACERQQRLELAQKELEKLRKTKTTAEAKQEARVSETCRLSLFPLMTTACLNTIALWLPPPDWAWCFSSVPRSTSASHCSSGWPKFQTLSGLKMSTAT